MNHQPFQVQQTKPNKYKQQQQQHHHHVKLPNKHFFMTKSNKVFDISMECRDVTKWIESVRAIERDNFMMQNHNNNKHTKDKNNYNNTTAIGEEGNEYRKNQLSMGLKESTFTWMQVTSSLLRVFV